VRSELMLARVAGVDIWKTSAAACGMARMPPARTLIRLGTKIFSVRYEASQISKFGTKVSNFLLIT
jgi:hypothetical protein